MRLVPWLVLAVGLCVGCDQRGGLGAGGLVFDSPVPQRAAPERGRDADRDPELRRLDPGNEPRRERFGDDAARWSTDSPARDSRPVRSGDDRSEMVSEPLPSRTERWGKDRSMPSGSMPGRTEKWGKEREMPGDSLPSRREAWGGERKMPSDSMPSRSVPRRTDPSEEPE